MKEEVKSGFDEECRFRVIHDDKGEEGRESATVWDKETGMMIIIGKPDSESGEGDLSVYFADHMNIYIDGKVKQKPRFIIDSDEYPTKIEERDTEDSFIGIF
jgi:hypothetical protein